MVLVTAATGNTFVFKPMIATRHKICAPIYDAKVGIVDVNDVSAVTVDAHAKWPRR
jgi:hypothetical protein